MAGVKRTKKVNKTKLYFNKDTENAIVKFAKTDCKKSRDNLYNNVIKRSFEKLAENLIFIHSFHSDTLPYEILKNDCVSFLFQTIHKFNPDKGSKAFSYFNVVAKNWLIANSKKDLKRRRANVSLDNFASLSMKDKTIIENHAKVNSPEKEMLIKETKDDLKEIFQKILKRLSSENEILCMNAIIEVFSKVDQLDLLNKRAVFVYLREISGLNPKQLSISMSNIRKHYREIVKNDKYNLIFR